MIQKAQPKSGLETGSVQSADGLRPAQKTESVWNSPEPQQDSADDAMRDALSQIRILGGPGLTVTGGNGVFTISVAQRNSAGVTEDALTASTTPWDLAASSTAGEYFIQNPGRIYSDPGDISSVLDVTDIDQAFSFGSSDIMFLELTFDSETDEPILTLNSDNEPTEDYPKLYEYSSPPEAPKLTRAVFPIWEGHSGAMPEGAIGKDFGDWWAESHFFCRDYILRWDGYTFDADWSHLAAPVLVPK